MNARVLFGCVDKKYESLILEKLNKQISNLIVTNDARDFRKKFTLICENPDTFNDTVVVDITNVNCINTVIEIYPYAIKKPKLIILTSLLTWCGDTRDKLITDPDNDFYYRIPTQSVLELYSRENILWKMAKELRNEETKVYFVSMGILYGDNGWDLETYFR